MFDKKDFTVGELLAMVENVPHDTPIILMNPVGRGQSCNIRYCTYFDDAIKIDGKTYTADTAMDKLGKDSTEGEKVTALIISEG